MKECLPCIGKKGFTLGTQGNLFCVFQKVMMFLKCPGCRRRFQFDETAKQCPACGLVFSEKQRKRLVRESRRVLRMLREMDPKSLTHFLEEPWEGVERVGLAALVGPELQRRLKARLKGGNTTKE